MKKHRLFLFLGLLPLQIFAQNTYYTLDSTTYVNSEVNDRGDHSNALYCYVENKGAEIAYTPDRVSEYGFSDGRIYKAFTVNVNGQTKKYFFEKLTNGDITIWYIHLKGDIKRFYVDENDLLKEIPQE